MLRALLPLLGVQMVSGMLQVMNCSQKSCASSSRWGEGKCWAGTAWERCTCAEGFPRLTGVTKSHAFYGVDPTTEYQYTCCSNGTLHEENCAEYVRPQYTVLLYCGFVCLLVGSVGTCAALFPDQVRRGIHKTFRNKHTSRRSRLSARDSKLIKSPIVQDGEARTRAVPFHKWCVSRADLLQFRKMVEEAIASGDVKPTDRDKFDPKDDRIGPMIYTVNQQLIMPVTAVAGNVSWALMLHPEGVICDLFVTHGWQEGVFEFIDKAVNSWPPGAGGAYCCMLSNPQNLDISDLIKTPLESPFAKALRSAKYMMVIPNSKGSIYSRAWCVYEAFLAYSWDKIIFISNAPIKNFWPNTLLPACVWLVTFGVYLVFFAAAVEHLGMDDTVLFEWFSQLSLAILTLGLLPYSRIRYLYSWITLRVYHCVVGALLGTCCASNFIGYSQGRPLPLTYVVPFSTILCLLAPAMEMDRMWAMQRDAEGGDLRRGYTGSIKNAECSVAADLDAIMKEVKKESSEDAVDHTVSVLIDSGMSTPQFRKVADTVGKLKNVGHWSSIALYGGLGIMLIWPFCAMSFFGTCTGGFEWIPFVHLAEGIVWVIVFYFQKRDARVWSTCCLFLLIPSICACMMGEFNVVPSCAGDASIALFVGPWVVGMSAAGAARTLQLPVLGPPLVKFLLGRFEISIKLKQLFCRMVPVKKDFKKKNKETEETFDDIEPANKETEDTGDYIEEMNEETEEPGVGA